MNWLIISPEIQDQNLKAIEDFLENKHNIIASEIYLSDSLSQGDLFDAVKHILQSTHCIVLDSGKNKDMNDYLYLLGVLEGKGVNTYWVSSGPDTKKYETLNKGEASSFKMFTDVKNCLSFIDSQFPSFIRQDDQRQALLQLFTLGLPFTSDCFAQYLAKDDTDVCQIFLDAGMLVNARTSEGVPLLCVATRNDCIDKVKWLVDNGADINCIAEDRGYSAVMDAVWRKNYDITEYLVNKGADLSFMSSDGQPILVLAVGNGNVQIVELLLAHGADPDIEDSMGMSARKYASLFKKPGMVEAMDKYPPKAK